MVTEASIAVRTPPSNLSFAASWLARWRLCGGNIYVTSRGDRFVHYPFRVDCETRRSALRALMGEFDDAHRSARDAVFRLASLKAGG